MDIDLKHLNYTLLPGKFCSSEQIKIYESAYTFWQSNWSEVYKKLGLNKKANPDDFFRQDYIPTITHQNQVIAIHLYTLYDLRVECTLEHSYLNNNFCDEFFAMLKNSGISKVMSMESLFVHEDFRKSKANLHLANTLITLGQKVFYYLTDADAIIAPARTDIKVAQIGYTLGFEPLIKEFRLNNVLVDLVVFKRQKAAQAYLNNTNLLTEQLWEKHLTSYNKARQAA